MPNSTSDRGGASAMPVAARIGELRELRDGWLDGAGRAPTSEQLDWFGDAFSAHFPADLPLPFVYPTPEGGLQLEWTAQPWEASLEIDLDDHRGQWHALDVETHVDEEHVHDLNSPEGWMELVERVRRTCGAIA